jgi:hypothetical protein
VSVVGGADVMSSACDVGENISLGVAIARNLWTPQCRKLSPNVRVLEFVM